MQAEKKWVVFIFVFLVALVISQRSIQFGMDTRNYIRILTDVSSYTSSLLQNSDSFLFVKILKVFLGYPKFFFFAASFFLLLVSVLKIDKIYGSHRLVAMILFLLSWPLKAYLFTAIAQSITLSFIILYMTSGNTRSRWLYLISAVGFHYQSGLLFSVLILLSELVSRLKKWEELSSLKKITLVCLALLISGSLSSLLESNLTEQYIGESNYVTGWNLGRALLFGIIALALVKIDLRYNWFFFAALSAYSVLIYYPYSDRVLSSVLVLYCFMLLKSSRKVWPIYLTYLSGFGL